MSTTLTAHISLEEVRTDTAFRLAVLDAVDALNAQLVPGEGPRHVVWDTVHMVIVEVDHLHDEDHPDADENGVVEFDPPQRYLALSALAIGPEDLS